MSDLVGNSEDRFSHDEAHMWVTQEIYNGGGGKQLKDLPLTSNLFGRLFAKHRNEDEFLMSIEILFHIRTPEKDPFP